MDCLGERELALYREEGKEGKDKEVGRGGKSVCGNV